MHKSLHCLLVVILTCATPLALAQSTAIASPEGSIILTITGEITRTNKEDSAVFDRALLEALEWQATVTRTPWSDGQDEYQGPLGRALLDFVGAFGSEMTITALNDYAVTMPVSDFYELPVILAMDQNGQAMRVRDKGPLFVLYPFDANPELNVERYHNRSVWQIKSIHVH